MTFEHNKNPARVPEGCGLLMAYPGAEAGARLLDADDERVVRAVLQDNNYWKLGELPAPAWRVGREMAE